MKPTSLSYFFTLYLDTKMAILAMVIGINNMAILYWGSRSKSI